MNFKDKIIMVILMAILIIGAIALVGGLFFFGFAGLFYMIGIEYTSNVSLIIFVLSFLLIGFIVDLFFEGFAKFANEYVEGKWRKTVVFLCSSFAGNFLVLAIVDGFMASITISLQAKCILALFLALIDKAFSTDDKKREKV